MSFMSAQRWALQETFRGFGRNPGLFAFGTVLAALALSIPLFIATVFYGLSEPLRTLPTAVEMTVFTTVDADAKKLENDIKPMRHVVHTEVIPKAQAFSDLNRSLGLEEKKNARNPLPDIIIVTLDEDATAEDIAQTAKAVQALKGVDFVPYEASWHEKLRAITQAAWVGVGCLGAVVLALVVLVLAASVRMTTFSAQTEMRALYLFGASPAFAIRPFAWRGMILMGAASLIALGLAQAGIAVFGRAVQDAAALYSASVPLALPPAKWCAAFVGGCVLAGAVVASLAAADCWRRVRNER